MAEGSYHAQHSRPNPIVRPLPTPSPQPSPPVGVGGGSWLGAPPYAGPSSASPPHDDFGPSFRRPAQGPGVGASGGYGFGYPTARGVSAREGSTSSSNSLVSPIHHSSARSHSPLPPISSYHPNHMPSAPPRSPISLESTVTSPLRSSAYITATKDHENFTVVDISRLPHPAAIRECVLTKLQIQDDEFFNCSFYVTRIGQGHDKGKPPLSDQELWDLCEKEAGGTVALYIRQEGPGTAAPEVTSAAKYQSAGAQSPNMGLQQSSFDSSSSRREKSASTSSQSSAHLSPEGAVNEFGERTSAPSSWQPRSTGTGSSSHRKSVSNDSAVAFGAPLDRSGGRGGQHAPPAPGDDYRTDEYGRQYQSSGRRPSEGQSHQQQQQGYSTTGSQIGRRPLPQPQNSQSAVYEPEVRQRGYTASGSTMPPAGSVYDPPSPQPPTGWTQSQTVRPLPPTDYRSYVSPPAAPPSQYHNIKVQALQSGIHSPQATLPPTQHPTLNAAQQNRMMPARSTGNLREHYGNVFEQDLRPTPPLPPQMPRPPPNPSYGASQTYQATRTQPPPVPPYPQNTHPPAHPHLPHHSQSYQGPPPRSFDISVMRSPNTGTLSSSSSLSSRPPPPQGVATYSSSHSPAGHQAPWPRRSPSEPVWSPQSDARQYGAFSGSIPLQPGQILQHSTGPSQRRPSAEMQSPALGSSAGSGRGGGGPPAALHMRSNDPSIPPSSARGVSMHEGDSRKGVDGSRRGSGGSNSDAKDGRDRRPGNAAPPAPSVRQRPSSRSSRERDSGSSYTSSSSATPPLWKYAPSAPPVGEDAYSGIEDERIYQSPPSSARSSQSGPPTPSSMTLAHSPPTKEVSDPIREWRAKEATPTIPPAEAFEAPTEGEGTVTIKKNEFAAFVSQAFDSESNASTLRPNPTSPQLPPPVAPAPPTVPVAAVAYDSDDDADEETSTYITAPKPPATPQPRVALYDEPSSRSPSNNRRPTLYVKTDAVANDPFAVAAGSSPQTSPLLDLKLKSGDEPGSAPPHSASSRGSGGRVRRAPQRGAEIIDGKELAKSGALRRTMTFAKGKQSDKDWAFRPKVEDVLDNLEEFFPNHDLNKPVFDAPSPPNTTPSPEAESKPSMSPINPAVAALKRGATGLGYKKSIKVVVGERRRNMLKASSRGQQPPPTGGPPPAASAGSAAILRRKSTKLFGKRVEEVTPAQITTMPEVQEEGSENFSFKWIKGEMIGRGSYGRVFIAFNVTAGETIAVKQVELPKTAFDKGDARLQGMVSSLKAEIELLKDLSHENIVEYLGMEETPDNLSIFLEYVPGGSVGGIIRKHGKFPEDVIKHFTFQILRGLAYMHDLGILHRDLKGDNILCDHEGICKISDFGTSKKSQDIYNNDANMSMQGSIFWMAPEVIQNEQRGYSAKADIWSLGCLCLEMFAGRRPWSENEMMQTMFKLGAEKKAPPVPEDVVLAPLAKAFFEACFQPDPDHRPRADQLMRHRFLEVSPDYSFMRSDLYKAISNKGEASELSPGP